MPDHEKLEDLIDRAWEAEKMVEQRSLALQALTYDANAIDAYVILGLVLGSDIERIALLREGVRRGKILWSDQMKRPTKHHFWLDLVSRPFMRACQNLALLLWSNNERAEAVELVKLLYRLNRNDNQGMRYLLLAWLPVIGDWSAFGVILKQCKRENGLDYRYAACMDAFRNGKTDSDLLLAALDANRFVPAFLLDAKLKPGVGRDQHVKKQAFDYAKLNREAWSSLSNSVAWLNREASRLQI